jgi:Right handed beta helix region
MEGRYPSGYCHGVYIGASNSLIEGGSYHDNDGFGIQIRHGTANDGVIPVSGIIVRNTQIYDNVNGGLIFVGCHNTAHDNVVTGNSSGLMESGCNTFYNNTFSNDANGDIIP